jgi:putative ABC transport system ATP-binding protein
MAASVVLRARQLGKQYRMGEVTVTALRDIDLDVQRGELIVILGPSGSGKSTLLHILGGLDTPTTGSFRYRDHDLSHANEGLLTHYRREHVGFVFQFYNLVPGLTARENVALAAELVPKPLGVDDCLALVGLSARADHFPAQLSGGEQQRVAIARAIAKAPDVLLCDEPTGALDVGTGRLVLAALLQARATLGTTVVVITHNAAIGGLADRVLMLADGSIAREIRNETRTTPEQLAW